MSLLIIGSGLVGSQIARLATEDEDVDAREEPIILFDVSPRIEALGEILDTKKVTVVQGDVLVVHYLYRVIKSFDVSRIIHTAANPLLTVGAQKAPYQAIQLNIMGTANVLEAARLYDVERVVFASSNVISLYAARGPFGFPIPTTIYSSTKLACEHLGLNYFTSYGIDFAAIRFSAVFGPWRYGGGGAPTQKFKVILLNALNKSTSFFPFSPMQYVYSKDAALGAMLAVQAKKSALKARVYNISMEKIYSAEEIKRIVEAIVPEAKIELEKEVSAPDLVEGHLVDLTSAKAELGFAPRYNMHEAITDYVNWLRTNGG